MRIVTLIFLSCFLAGCISKTPSTSGADDALEENTRFRESYRPQYHFTPPEKWMNDPNGLLYHDGVYHLFYQHYPEDIVWGPMHWGHAVSRDLISWEHKPIALYPDELGLIFSGSAVMDMQNTSGLGTLDNPPMVAIYTYHLMEGEQAGRKDFQYQGIAYSLDKGDTWTKYKNNPVIGNPTGIKDFRDPKVMWYAPTKQWIMTLVAGDHAKFYSSPNLKDWKLLSEFGRDKGAHGGVWECPDLFPLQVAGTEETKWVLLISINPGAPNGGSGTQYFVGDWDGTTFTTDQEAIKWLDYGTDNYAGVTYNGLPDDQRIFIGWMSNWNYARNTPTKVWRSAMTLPRKLSLVSTPEGYLLKNAPLEAIENYVEKTRNFSDIKPNDIIEFEALQQSRIHLTVDGTLQPFSLRFWNDQNEEVLFGYDHTASQFYLDRRKSGQTDFESRFADRKHIAPAILEHTKDIEISIFLDASSIEVFIDGGATVLTDQLFPNAPYKAMIFEGEAIFTDVKISKVKRIWD